MRLKNTNLVLGACVALWGLVYLWHFILLGARATGFIHYDLPSYLAHARAIFTMGNGIFFPNPFNPNTINHAIYFQWPLWIYGALMEEAHFSPSFVFAFATLAGAAFMAIATKILLDERIGKAWISLPILVLAFWGGGLITLGGYFHVLTHPALWHHTRLAGLIYDPAGGWWMRNWGRNLLYYTESLYHGIVALQWVFILRRKWYLALIATIAIGLAHPWTGLEMTALFIIWILIERIFFARNNLPVPNLVVAGAILFAGVFGYYYGMYLPSFPEHRAIVERWSVDWNVSVQSFALELALVITAAVYYLWKKKSINRDDLFLLTAFFVTVIAVKHDIFLRPVQPVHFDHGYPWMALFLLGLPATVRLFRNANRGLIWKFAASFLLLIAVLDNAYFVQMKLKEGSNSEVAVVGMNPEFYPLFDSLRTAHARGILVTPDPISGYLSALYTNCVAYTGHGNLSPDFERHVALLDKLNSGESGPWLDSCDYLIRPMGDALRLDSTSWKPVAATKNYVLYANFR